MKRSVRAYHVHPDAASRRSIHAARMKTSLLAALETEIRFLRPDVALIHVHWELTGQAGPDGAVLPTRQGILSHVVVKTAANGASPQLKTRILPQYPAHLPATENSALRLTSAWSGP